jgi:O-antigen/teichoic acid export membrane protein
MPACPYTFGHHNLVVGMLKRALKNFGVVIRGRGIAAVFSVMATGLMANALTATEFGLVILLHTYMMVIQGVLNFRTFETIIRFGIPLGDARDGKGLRTLLRSTMMIDMAAALLATVLGIAAAPLAGHVLQWDSDMVGWAAMYSLVILTTANGTSNGILRIYDRFDALSVQFTVAPALRFLMVSIAWALDAPMPVFIIAWGSAFAVGHIYMMVRGLRELKAHMDTSLWSGFHWQEIRNRPREFWKFTGVVYWQTVIDLLPKHVSTLLAGALLGPAAAGLFRLAREFSTVLTQPAMLLREVLFPDLTRSFHAQDEGFHSVPWKTAFIAGTAGLAFVVLSLFIGRPVLGFVGEEYAAAAPLLSLMLLAATFELAGASLRAAVYAMGRAGSILRIHTIGIVTYMALFFVLTPMTGLIGPGLAGIVSSVLVFSLTGLLIKRIV